MPFRILDLSNSRKCKPSNVECHPFPNSRLSPILRSHSRKISDDSFLYLQYRLEKYAKGFVFLSKNYEKLFS